MIWYYLAYILAVFASAVAAAALSAYAWRHRTAPGAATFAWLMLTVAAWSLLVALELVSGTPSVLLVLVKVEYVAIASVPLALLAFALEYAGHQEWLVPRRLALLALIPLVTVVLYWTNEAHGLIWFDYNLPRQGPFLLQDVTYGAWFWVHIAYSYLLLSASTALIVLKALRSSHVYRRQAMAMLVGVSIPWVGNLLYVFRLSPVPYLDLTPFGFALGGLAFAWALFRYRLLDLAPVARDALIDSMSDGMIVLDEQKQIVDLNPVAQSMLGLSIAEAIGQPAAKVLSPWPDLVDHWGHGSETYSEITVGQGQMQRHYDLGISALTDRHESLTGWLMVLHDVTERKKAENLQRALYDISEAANSAQSLEALYERVHQIVSQLIYARNLYIALYDERSGIVSYPYHVDDFDPVPTPQHLSQWEHSLTGYLIRKGMPLLVVDEADREALRREGVRRVGTRCHCWLGVPLKTAGARTVGAMVVQSYADGITYGEREKEILTFVSTQIAMAIERKKAEGALRESEEHFRSVFYGAGMGISIVTLSDGRFLDVNPALQDMLGYTAVELTQMAWPDVTHPDDVEKDWKLTRGLISGVQDIGEIEKRFLRKDGAIMWGRLAVSLVRDGEGNPQFAVGMVQDITQHRQAEKDREEIQAQLLQAQKMEAVGRLTAGIAHDFNNLLTVINGYGERLQQQMAPDHPLQQLVERIVHSGWRAADLVRQLLIFSRKQVVEPQVLDLNAVVMEIEKLLRRVIGEDVELQTLLSPDLWPVRVDSTQLEQVIVNLAVNARDAMPDGGQLSIETANVTLEEGGTASHPGVQPGGYVLLVVTDTGVGISAEVKERIFEPYFTTKEEGKGTGLGLTTVYTIVQQNYGHISVDSQEGKGSRFRILLPRFNDVPQSTVHQQSATEVPGGNETILVVEDDGHMRDLIRHVLQDQGYETLVAGNGQQALEALAAHAGTVHLLLADVVLPGMSGKGVAERVASIRPGVRVLFMSGYTDEEIAHHGVLDEGVAFLPKPFTPTDLARKVRAVLET
jgi:PAS domain S-box-containing protein